MPQPNDINACRPVFIAGCGRSGTSFLRTVIDAHPLIYIPSESLFIVDYLKHFDHVPEKIARLLLYYEPQLRCWHKAKPRPIHNISQTIADFHVSEATKRNAIIWGQKTPRFIRYRNLLESHFGEIKWLLIYRDPRSVAASMRLSGQHTNSIKCSIRRWKKDNLDIVNYLNKEIPISNNVKIVKYEDLINNFDEEIKLIFDFIGVNPIDRETIERLAEPVFFERSRFANNTVRDGVIPDNRKINNWTNVLSPSEISTIEHTCSYEMETMGYTISTTDTKSHKEFADSWHRIKDINIIIRYLIYWPSYPFYVVTRKAIFNIFKCIKKL